MWDKTKETASGLARPFLHPIDSFESDPVGTTASWYGAKKLMPGEVPAAIGGASRAAMSQVRPTLDKFSLWHPLKNVGLGYDAIANTVKGGMEAVHPPENSPFNKFRDVSPPSSGGRSFDPTPTGIEGGNVDQSYKKPLPADAGGNFSKYREVTPLHNGGRPIEPTPTNIEGGNTVARTPVARIPSTISDANKTPDMPVGPTPKPVLASGRRVPNAAPETPPVQAPSAAATQVPTPEPAPQNASRPVTRNVIHDEQGQPVAYEGDAPDHNIPAEEGRAPKTENPMDRPYQEMQNRRAADANKEPQDVFDQIAAEGTAKRAADARAKYEDVYQNVIKGNYSPEDLRNLTPETKTKLDLKIRSGDNLKKKYGSGLNPVVTESLAQRLESETPQATPDQANLPTN